MDLQKRISLYKEDCCWQYSIRVQNREEDLKEHNLSEEYVEKLTIKDFEFKHIDDEDKEQKDKAKLFIEKHEWLGGLAIYTSDWFVAYHKDILAGVVLMGMPNAFSKLLGSNIECLDYLIPLCPAGTEKVKTRNIERLINRGACISWSPKGLASALIMWSIRWIVKNPKYRFRLFTAYSDPMAKEIGTIYQACNFYYLGQKSGGTKRYKGRSGNMISDRSFRTRSAYKRYAKELGIKWDEKWSKTLGLNWDLIPKDIQIKLKNASKEALKNSEVVTFPSKHKYAYVLGRNKAETKNLRKLFLENNKVLPYPKRDIKDNDMKSILSIIDGNYFVNYASHAAVADLHGPHGEPTGALHVFLNTLWGIKQKLQGNMIVVFDGGHAAFRDRIYPDYKKRKKAYDATLETTLEELIEDSFKDTDLPIESINRVKEDLNKIQDTRDSEAIDEYFKNLESLEELEERGLSKQDLVKMQKEVKKEIDYFNRENMKKFTFSTLCKLLPAMGIPAIRIPGEEADDVIYLLTKQLINEYSLYCVTSDEDFVQMVGLGATVMLYRQDVCINAKNFENRYKFDLKAFTLYKSIKGDVSDNIKGVPGIGSVHATKIIKSLKEPTLEALYDLCCDSKDKKHLAVMGHFKTIKRNLRLMDLEYAEIDKTLITETYKKAVDNAILNLPLVKKIFLEFNLQTAGTKWLSELIRH